MADQKPPRLTADERTTLYALWQYHRESLVRKLDGIDDAIARRPQVPSGTSLLWLVKHSAGAEMRWVLWGFARSPPDVRADDITDADTIGSVTREYRATWKAVDDVVANADFDAECPAISGTDTVNLRWIVTHLLEETARHAGHADILRELLDGQPGR